MRLLRNKILRLTMTAAADLRVWKRRMEVFGLMAPLRGAWHGLDGIFVMHGRHGDALVLVGFRTVAELAIAARRAARIRIMAEIIIPPGIIICRRRAQGALKALPAPALTARVGQRTRPALVRSA